MEATQNVWELSHDFVARAVGRYLGRRRVALFRRAGAYAAPTLLALGVVTGFAAFEWHRLAPGQVRAKIADLGISVETHKDGLHARSTNIFGPDKIPAIASLLSTLSVVEPDLSHTPVADLGPLKGLTALQHLNLSFTRITDLEPLEGLTALQRLNLSDTHFPDSNVKRFRLYREQNGLSAIDVQK